MQLYTIIIVHTSRSSVRWAREPTPIQLLSCLIIHTIQIEKKNIQLLENNKKAKQDSQVHDTEENFV